MLTNIKGGHRVVGRAGSGSTGPRGGGSGRGCRSRVGRGRARGRGRRATLGRSRSSGGLHFSFFSLVFSLLYKIRHNRRIDARQGLGKIQQSFEFLLFFLVFFWSFLVTLQRLGLACLQVPRRKSSEEKEEVKGKEGNVGSALPLESISLTT